MISDILPEPERWVEPPVGTSVEARSLLWLNYLAKKYRGLVFDNGQIVGIVQANMGWWHRFPDKRAEFGEVS